MNYSTFLESKKRDWVGCGMEATGLPENLKDFQSALTRWALKKGRAAIFADTGLGKTWMQVAWAAQIPGRVLIIAPLCVTTQTIGEAAKMGIAVGHLGSGAQIEITNYERLHHVTASDYTGIVLDESSILKSFDGKTRSKLIDLFQGTPYRLCCTATPAPNDIAELANHCEFLGIMTRSEMLATFFVHDENGWRLKGHAHDAFYRWLSSWGMFLRYPSELGFSDDGYQLPGLSIEQVVVKSDALPHGEFLFPGMGLGGIRGRIGARRDSITHRVRQSVEEIFKSWTSANTCVNGHRKIEIALENIELLIGKKETHEGGRSIGKTRNRLNRKCGNGTWTTQEQKETGAFDPTMGSSQKSTRRFLRTRGSAALSADQIAGHSTLTMNTPSEQSGESSALIATLPLESLETIQRLFGGQPFTSKVHLHLKPWVVWCGLNDEQDMIAELLGDLCVSVQGKTTESDKISMERNWRSGLVPVMVTKPEVFGWGMNWQHCPNEIFLGIGDSYEKYYQAIRRCYRFGQTHPVTVKIVVSEAETEIVRNVQRKESEASKMASDLMAHVVDIEREEIGVQERERVEVVRDVAHGDRWTLHKGDCIEVMPEIPDNSVDLSVYSPPFLALYTYTNSARDIGNCSSREEFLEHFGYVVRELFRVTKPGRLTCCHVQQVTTQLAKDGVIGMSDLRGAVIECFSKNGWIYHGDVTIDKDPQAQAIRTHSKALLFAQLRKDASWLRPALADYIAVFRKPGVNAVAIHPDITNEDWIEWARPIWYNIRESDTLNVREARANDDDRHVCPLQLGTIERCVRLWSNPGEVVFSPFAGIGSEGYQAILNGRKFLGVELKPEYFKAAAKNLTHAEESVTAQGVLTL